MNNDLQFDQTNPSILNPEIIKKDYKIIDAFHQLKKNNQVKQDNIHDKNGMASHRSVLFCRNNIKCNRNVAGSFAIFNLNVCFFIINFSYLFLEGGHDTFDQDINASNNIMKLWTLEDQGRSQPKTFTNFVFDKKGQK